MMPAAEHCWCCCAEPVMLVYLKSWRRNTFFHLKSLCLWEKEPIAPKPCVWLEWCERPVLQSAPCSSLNVLLSFYVWVNPAFYQWHNVMFTKRISVLEGTESGRRATHFYTCSSNINITKVCFFLEGSSLWSRKFSLTQHVVAKSHLCWDILETRLH